MNCVVEGCDKEVLNKMRGYCKSHYTKFRKYGVPEVIKECEECKKTFVVSTNFQVFCSSYCKGKARLKSPVEKMKAKIRHKEYRQTEKGKEESKQSLKRQREKSPEKYKARTYLRNRVASGKVIKPEVCGLCMEPKKLEAHHHKGYLKENWLDVVWLCRTCHIQEERLLRNQQDV